MTEKVLCLFCHCVCPLNHKCDRVTSTDGYRGWTYCPPAGQGRELFADACSGIGGVRAEPGEGQVPPESKLTPTLPPWIPRLPMSGETLPGGLHTGSGHSQKSKLPTGFLVKGLDIHPATGLQELGSPEEQKAPQDLSHGATADSGPAPRAFQPGLSALQTLRAGGARPLPAVP